jgi:hypothetical protein
VWGITGAILLLAGVLYSQSFLRSYHAFHNRLAVAAETVLRHDWEARTDSAVRVIVLGTSLTGAGVLSPAYFAQHTNGRYQVTKLYRPAANLESFTERAPIFELLVRYPPDILCIEENLLFFDLKDGSALTPDTLLAENLLYYLPRLAEHTKEKLGWQKLAAVPTPQKMFSDMTLPPADVLRDHPSDTIHYGWQLKVIGQRVVRPYAAPNPVHRYLQALRSKGTRIVILHFPRPAPLEQAINRPAVAKQLTQLRRQYQEAVQAEYWHEPGAYPFGCFYDYAHLNLKGRAAYSAWLAGRLLADRSLAGPRAE